jgi:hypothetical protein
MDEATKESYLKRILILLTALFALSLFSGCSHKAVNNNAGESDELVGDLPSAGK